MGSTRSRQGSAALSHVQGRAPRQAIALVAALVVVLLAAPVAMAGTARVDGTTLFYRAPAAGEVNNVTVAQSGDSYTITDAAPMTAGPGCSEDGGAVVCTADPAIDQIWVNAGDGDDTVVIAASTRAQVFGGAGNDTLGGGSGEDLVDGSTGNDIIEVQDGVRDSVSCGDGSDSVTSDRADVVPRPQCEFNDDGFSPTTTILAGPLGPPGNTAPHFDFQADEPAQFFCAVAPVGAPMTFESCVPNQALAAPTEGEWVFKVYAQDDIGPGSVAEVAFVVDTTPPTVTISGPASPIATSTPTFDITADEPSVRFECALDGGPFTRCDASYTALPLADGDHVLEVRGTDPGRNETIATFPFRVAMPGSNTQNGVAPAAPPVAPRRIIIDSLVLISGARVKMSRRGVVGIRLTCAGRRTCKGRMRITTAAPVRRKSKKLVTLGSKRFSISANKSRKIKVRFSKSKRRLARRLKRFKAKVVINEVDERGNTRISSRVFILRAR